MKEIFNLTLADSKTKVPVLGTRIDEYFAWTPEADANNPIGKLSVISHIPTGCVVRKRVGSLGDAKRIVEAYLSKLKGVNWATDSFTELRSMVGSKRNKKAVAEIKDYDGKQPRQVRNLQLAAPQDRLAVVLNTKEWAGSEVLRTEEENGELVHYLKHSSGARMRLLAGVSRPCEE